MVFQVPITYLNYSGFSIFSHRLLVVLEIPIHWKILLAAATTIASYYFLLGRTTIIVRILIPMKAELDPGQL